MTSKNNHKNLRKFTALFRQFKTVATKTSYLRKFSGKFPHLRVNEQYLNNRATSEQYDVIAYTLKLFRKLA